MEQDFHYFLRVELHHLLERVHEAHTRQITALEKRLAQGSWPTNPGGLSPAPSSPRNRDETTHALRPSLNSVDLPPQGREQSVAQVSVREPTVQFALTNDGAVVGMNGADGSARDEKSGDAGDGSYQSRQASGQELEAVPGNEMRLTEARSEARSERTDTKDSPRHAASARRWSARLSNMGATGNDSAKIKTFEEVLSGFEEARANSKRKDDNGPFRIQYLERLAKDPRFEIAFSVLILLNATVFALQTQIEGWDKGARQGLTRSDYVFEEHEGWRALMDALQGVSSVIGVIFLIEVVVKFAGLGYKSFSKDWWNWFDTFIVAGWLLEDMSSSVGFPLDPRALRSFRLMRLLRVLRLLRTIQLFDALYLLNAAFKGSIGVLMWSMVYLGVVQIALALVLTEGIHNYFLDDTSHDSDGRQEVYDYFGTASRATLTMFEMTLANWPPVCRVMVENVGEWWVVFALLHKLTMGFAFIGIFNGVIMQETFKAAAQDSNVMIRDKQRAREKLSKEMRTVFDCADSDKDGQLDLQGFMDMCSNPVLKMWLASLGLNTRDAVKVFHLIDGDTGDGKLNADELIDGVERFRGVASGIDLHISMHELRGQIMKHFQEQDNQLSRLTTRINKWEEIYLEDEMTGPIIEV